MIMIQKRSLRPPTSRAAQYAAAYSADNRVMPPAPFRRRDKVPYQEFLLAQLAQDRAEPGVPPQLLKVAHRQQVCSATV